MRKKRQETVLAFFRLLFVHPSLFLRSAFALCPFQSEQRAKDHGSHMGVTTEEKGWKHDSVVANMSVPSVVERTRAIVADMPMSPQIRVALR